MDILIAVISVVAIFIYYQLVGPSFTSADASSFWTIIVYVFFPLFGIPAVVFGSFVAFAVLFYKIKVASKPVKPEVVVPPPRTLTTNSSLSPDAVLYLARKNQNSRYRSYDESAFFYTNEQILQSTKAISRSDREAYDKAAAHHGYGFSQEPSHQRSGIDLLINYPDKYGDKTERRITAYGLGRFDDCYYIIAFCHLRGGRRTFKLANFRGCTDLATGQHVTSVKSHILKFNPNVIDLTDEFDNLIGN